ncbi:MAG: hypothetical protein K0S05_1462, partial [Agromyces sp.]|nr:hypothetical protein [Agromyces sp.]
MQSRQHEPEAEEHDGAEDEHH